MWKTGAIDDVHRAVSETTDEAKRTEGKRIVEDLAKLKYELQHDRKLTYAPHTLSLYSSNPLGPFKMMENPMLQVIMKSLNN